MTTLIPRMPPLRETLGLAVAALSTWSRRQVAVAAAVSVAAALLIGVATVLIPNPIFAREIAPVWWNYPVWLVTSVLAGMLVATYVRGPLDSAEPAEGVADRGMVDRGMSEKGDRRSSRLGMAGGILAWFAVGCPVCNKIALLALGYTGALTWFAPIQPVLAVGALLLTGGALLYRLRGQVACPMPQTALATSR